MFVFNSRFGKPFCFKASTTEGLLKAAQEELQEQRQMISDLEKLNEEKECSLDQQVCVLHCLYSK